MVEEVSKAACEHCESCSEVKRLKAAVEANAIKLSAFEKVLNKVCEPSKSDGQHSRFEIIQALRQLESRFIASENARPKNLFERIRYLITGTVR